MTHPERRGLLSRIGNGITTARIFVSNLLFIVVLLVLLGLVFGGDDGGPSVPDGAALVIELDAPLVEQPPPLDPIDLLTDGDRPRPIALRDLKLALEEAATDRRIGAVVLDLDAFPGAAPGTLRAVGRMLDDYRAGGKPLIVAGDGYRQAAYYLASHADQLYLNPNGSILLTGFGIHPTYFAAALEKLRVNMHVFRVGTYKDAVEPFLRDDMSEAARESNQALLEAIWNGYRGVLARNRAMQPETLDGIIENYPALLRAANGDPARLALENGLVDELLGRDEARERIAGIVGRDEDSHSFRQVSMGAYVADVKAARVVRVQTDERPKVAVIVAEGPIVSGRTDETQVVGDRTAALIRRARLDDDIEAIVLRVNSPGGSAFASEVVRKELELAQVSAKPVVASMGGVAASGGYWISATADRIVAESETLTGSIGIFGILPTFEDSGDALGLSADGVGTHAISGAMNPLLPLNPGLAEMIQLEIEHGYRQFLDIVARGREMTPDDVDAIAQGRVWAGSTALELGLVDELGGLERAVELAAELAGLDDWQLEYVERRRSAQERFLEQLLSHRATAPVLREMASLTSSPFQRAWSWVQEPLRVLGALSDPGNLYALCMACGGLTD